MKLNKENLMTLVLIVLILILTVLNIDFFEVEEPTNILFNKSTNTLNLSSLTLKQKIAQMTVAYWVEGNRKELQNMVIGGVYMAAEPTKKDFLEKVGGFQSGAVVPFLVAVDLEGCVNPFANFQEFPALNEIKTEEKAYELGLEQGQLLKELGIKINFAPVVDLEDKIWQCRSFTGTPEQISKKAVSYISGLQERGILATSKHYPGKTLCVRDPHKQLINADIGENDLLPFKQTIKNNVSAVMISYVIANGSVTSEDKPSATSERIVTELKTEFDGLVVTDDTDMLGLRNYYPNKNQMYIDLFKAGNDLILIFNREPKEIYEVISTVEDAVNSGKISYERIDESVIKILNAKGIKVVK